MTDIDRLIPEIAAHVAVATRLQTELGYPFEAVGTDVWFPHDRRVDIAVFKPDAGTLLAVFEIKRAKKLDATVTVELRTQLQAVRPHANSVPLYGVVLAEDSTVQYYRYADDGTLVPIVFEDIPKWSALVGGAVVALVSAKRDTRAAINRKSTVFSFVSLALFVAGVLGLWTPSWELLALLGGCFLLALLPDISYLRFLGLEIGVVRREKPRRLEGKSEAGSSDAT